MAKTYKVVVLKDDTLKPEVTRASVEIFKQFTKSSFKLDFSYGEAGCRFIPIIIVLKDGKIRMIDLRVLAITSQMADAAAAKFRA
jgi:hypothetical protein